MRETSNPKRPAAPALAKTLRLSTSASTLAAASLLLAAAALAQERPAPTVAQDFQRIQPQELPPNPPAQAPLPPAPPPAPKADPQAVILDRLDGILFLAKPAQVAPRGRAVVGIDLHNVPLLDTPAFRAELAPFIGKKLTFGDLEAIRKLATEFFRANDRPLVYVAVPPQDIEGNTIQIVALQFVAGNVRIEGNKWFSTGMLAGQVQTKPGEPVSASQVIGDVDWLNTNPFRKVDVSYAPGDKAGETTVTYNVQDRLPLRVYTGYQNNGTQTTDRNRLFAGFSWGNAFWQDQQLSYQFTASPDFSEFKAHSATYRVPLPWRDWLVFFGSYAESVPQLNNSFGDPAVSSQISARYQHTLTGFEAFTHHVDLGFDFKRSTSNLTFNGLSVLTGATEIDQFVAAYEAQRPDPYGSTAAGVSFVYSPGGLSGDNTSAAFQPAATQSGRSFANANYFYATFHIDRATKLPYETGLITRFTGQWANGNLLSSEQFGLGGATSVRGYDEREINTDSGLFLSNELRSPGISVFHLTGWNPGVEDKLQLLTFWDYGFGAIARPDPGMRRAFYLSSVGIGLRYEVGPYLSASADWGFPLIKVLSSDRPRAHLAVTLAY